MESWFLCATGVRLLPGSRLGDWAWTIVTSVYGGSQKFVLPGCSLHGSHLESGTLFPLRFVSDSHVPCVGDAFGVLHWTFREIIDLLVCVFVGSTVDTCSASVLGVWKNCTHFLRCGRLES